MAPCEPALSSDCVCDGACQVGRSCRSAGTDGVWEDPQSERLVMTAVTHG